MNFHPSRSFGAPVVKRKVFFSFHFADIMRVNNVRNAWKIDHPDAPNARSFYDSSLWESRKLEGDEALKRLIREGQEYTSAVCVLIGTDTWSREWVLYEIARSVIDNRGLLGVHINGINHHQRLRPDPLGASPFAVLGIEKYQPNALSIPLYYLSIRTSSGWQRYAKHTTSVALPRYLADPSPGYVMPLSTAVPVYDFVAGNGHKNIGAWVDAAAQAVGR